MSALFHFIFRGGLLLAHVSVLRARARAGADFLRLRARKQRRSFQLSQAHMSVLFVTQGWFVQAFANATTTIG